MLNQEAIQEFQNIYEQEFGEKLSDDEARLMGSELLDLYLILSQP